MSSAPGSESRSDVIIVHSGRPQEVGGEQLRSSKDVCRAAKMTKLTKSTSTSYSMHPAASAAATTVSKAAPPGAAAAATPPPQHQHIPFNPFHLLLQEQAKFMVAIKELQSQVQTLHDFRSRVLIAFPHLESMPAAAPRRRASALGLGRQVEGGWTTYDNLKKSFQVGPKGAGRILPSIRMSATSPAAHQAHPVMAAGSQELNLKSKINAASRMAKSGQCVMVMNGQQVATCARTPRRVTGWPSPAPNVNVNDTGGGQKFVVVAQGKNWLRIRPYSCEVDNSDGEEDMEEDDEDDVEAEDEDDDDEDVDDDEPNSTSDSLHSIHIGPSKSSRGGVLVKSSKTGAGHNSSAMRGQDSGFSTDGKVSGHLHSSSSEIGTTGHQWSKEEHHQHQQRMGAAGCGQSRLEDELMTLLDQIGHHSFVMRAQMDRSAVTSSHPGQISLSDIGLQADEVLAELDQLRSERDQLQERLTSDRLLHGRELARLQEELADKEGSKLALEERMEMLVTERERLINFSSAAKGHGHHHHHHLHHQNGLSHRHQNRLSEAIKRDGRQTTTLNEQKPKIISETANQRAFSLTDSGPISEQEELDNSKKLPVHVDRSRVTAILTQRHPLELQRQLLSAEVEHALTDARQKRTAAEWHQRTDTWKRTELSLRAEAEVARQSNVQLQVMVHQMEMDLEAERSKRQVLERALHSAYKDLTAQQQGNNNGPSAGHNVRHEDNVTTTVQRLGLALEEKRAETPALTTWKETTTTANGFKVKDGDHFHQFVGRRVTDGSALLPKLEQQKSAARSDDEDNDEERHCATSSTPMDTLKYISASELGRHQAEDTTTTPSRLVPPQTRIQLMASRAASRRKSMVDAPQPLLGPAAQPKTRLPYNGPSYIVPRYSQSAEDVRDIDWEWTYDVTRAQQVQQQQQQQQQMPSRVSYVAVSSLMQQHQRRAISEART